MNEQFKVPKIYLDILDQIFEIEKKVEVLVETNSLNRNVKRLKEIFEQLDVDGGLHYHNPISEIYSDTRTDIEVSIAGESAENLIITEVIKPIIRYRKGGLSFIVRKGIVVAESKFKTNNS